MKNAVKILVIVLSAALLFAAAYADVAPVMYGGEQLTALMDNLENDIQPGAAGSSLRATARAAELMKWGMNTKMTEDEIRDAVEHVIAGVPEEQKDGFNEALESVYDFYCLLLTDSATELLQEAGCDPAEYDFTGIESVEAVETVMTCAGVID